MRILGLDPATHCGWSLIDTASRHLCGGVWHLGRTRLESSPAVLKSLWNCLEALHEQVKLGAVGCEDAALGSSHPSTRAWHNELKGVIRCWCQVAGVEAVEFFAPTALKAFATGSGKAGKEAMEAAYARETRAKSQDHNHADAYFAMKYMERQMNLPEGLRQSQQEHAKRVQRGKLAFRARMRSGDRRTQVKEG